MIGSSENNRENYPRKCFWTQEKDTRIKFNPGLSANRSSNNWTIRPRAWDSRIMRESWQVLYSTLKYPGTIPQGTPETLPLSVKFNLPASYQCRMMSTKWLTGFLVRFLDNNVKISEAFNAILNVSIRKRPGNTRTPLDEGYKWEKR